MRIYLNHDWKFIEQYAGNEWENAETVQIPHTCKETPLHYFDENEYQMVSGYAKEIEVPAEWQGKCVVLTFDGVGHSSEVFLNGTKVGEHHCGYTAFSIDLTNHLSYGEVNQISVKVDSRESQNIPPFGHVIDYMTFGGIYRDVYLDVKESVCFSDVFVHSDLKVLTTEIELNKWKENAHCCVSLRKKGGSANFILGERKLEKQTSILRFGIPKIELWDVESPNLYEIKIELLYDGNTKDERIITFGFRNAEFRADGFYLNGKKLKIRGLNRHQSYPYVGYAMPQSMQKLDADILKWELGLNAVRTSHYPQSHYFLNRCDEIGLLVFTELPGWQHIGDEAWKEQACQNVYDMVRQYRNHTSIILWGVRINESLDDDAFYEETNRIAHELDNTRPTGGVRNFKKSNLLEDVYTYNEFVHNGMNVGCEPKKNVTSDRKKAYLITEYNGHMFPTKSFDCEEHRQEHALRHANVLDAVAGHDDIAGSFGWCMFDYNTHQDFGSGDRVCYHGVLDMFRNPKMAAAVYASQQDDIPVLEVSSGMEIGGHPETAMGDVYFFTNAESVRMYKNNRLINEFFAEDSDYKNMPHGPIKVTDVVGDVLIQEEGFTKDQSDTTKYILNAVAKKGMSHLSIGDYLRAAKLILKYHMTVSQVTDLYTKYVGNWGESAIEYRFDAVKEGLVTKSVTKSPMKRAELKAVADHTILKEMNSYDVALVRIRMESEYGNILTFSTEPLLLETEGPIEVIGPKMISLQGGMGGVYVKTVGKVGEASLSISDSKGTETKIAFTIE